jgi:hypothetical protein
MLHDKIPHQSDRHIGINGVSWLVTLLGIAIKHWVGLTGKAKLNGAVGAIVIAWAAILPIAGLHGHTIAILAAYALIHFRHSYLLFGL